MVKSSTDKLIHTIMAVWTMLTTIIYTLVLGTAAIIVAQPSKTGIAPYFMGKIWSWLIIKTNGVRLQVVGAEKIMKEKSYIFIANHASHLDPPAIAVSLPHTMRFIGKRSLSKIPVFGQAVKLARMIIIDRTNSPGAIEAINKSINELKNGISAFVFAEGTRSLDGTLKAFKKGGIMLALKANLPIIPIAIVDSYKLLPKNALRIRSGLIKIIVGDPIDTNGYTEADKDFLVQRVRDSIAENLDRYGHACYTSTQ